MKRTCILLATVLAGAAAASAVSSAQGGVSTAHTARVAKVQLRRTSLGRILVNASGFTLYRFTRDGRNRDRCVKVSGCASVWPALTTSGRPAAGSGVRASLLSTITLPGGAKQVTYAGHPLYTYSGDSGPGQTFYVGAAQFGGTWYALNAAGGAVK
jgi:predicted lipoprotein with Yx(FWY)xxD motif